MKRIAIALLISLIVVGFAFSQSGARGRGRAIPQDATLIVRSNVSNAQMSLNGSRQGGGPPWEFTLDAETYRIAVVADGYQTFRQTVTLEAGQTTTVNANLEPITYDLNVDPGIGDAQIVIEGAGQGRGSLRVSLRPGTYTVRITAPGFQNFRTQVTIRGDQTLRPTLQPAFATLQIEIPREMIAGDPDEMEDEFDIYVDGQLQSGMQFQVEPGRRQFRLESGAWAVNGDFVVEAGRTYVLRPRLTLSLEQ